MDSDPTGLDDPELPADRLNRQHQGKLVDPCKDGAWRKSAPAVEDRDAGAVLWREAKHFAKIAVERDKNAAFDSACLLESDVGTAAHPLHGDGGYVVALSRQHASRPSSPRFSSNFNFIQSPRWARG
jgi:hypothetical protein